jgi:hypothetical protein
MKGAKRQRRCETVELPFELWMLMIEWIGGAEDAISLRNVAAMAAVCRQWSDFVRAFFALRLADVQSITRNSPLSVPFVTNRAIMGAWLTVYKPSRRPMVAVPFHLFDETPIGRPEEDRFVGPPVFQVTATTVTAFYWVYADDDDENIHAITVDRSNGTTVQVAARLPTNGGTIYATAACRALDDDDAWSHATRCMPDYEIVLEASVDDTTGEIVVRCLNMITRVRYWERRTNVKLFVDDYCPDWDQITVQFYDEHGSIIVSWLPSIDDSREPLFVKGGERLFWLLA